MAILASYFEPLSSQLIVTFDDAAPLSLGQIVDPHLREQFILEPETAFRGALDHPGTVEAIASHCGRSREEVEAMVRDLLERMESDVTGDGEGYPS